MYFIKRNRSYLLDSLIEKPLKFDKDRSELKQQYKWFKPTLKDLENLETKDKHPLCISPRDPYFRETARSFKPIHPSVMSTQNVVTVLLK